MSVLSPFPVQVWSWPTTCILREPPRRWRGQPLGPPARLLQPTPIDLVEVAVGVADATAARELPHQRVPARTVHAAEELRAARNPAVAPPGRRVSEVRCLRLIGPLVGPRNRARACPCRRCPSRSRAQSRRRARTRSGCGYSPQNPLKSARSTAARTETRLDLAAAGRGVDGFPAVVACRGDAGQLDVHPHPPGTATLCADWQRRGYRIVPGRPGSRPTCLPRFSCRCSGGRLPGPPMNQ